MRMKKVNLVMQQVNFPCACTVEDINQTQTRRRTDFCSSCKLQMVLTVISGLTLLSILQLSAQQGVDRTLVPGASGAAVVRATVNKIQDVFGDDHQFLRRIAFVESKDGTDKNTYRPGYHGGIWQVDEIGFQATQDTASHSRLKERHKKINEEFGIKWPSVQWSDLRIPLYSAIAARLFLLNIPGDIPCDIQGQANYWKAHC